MAQHSNYNPQNTDKFQVSKEDKFQMNFNGKEFQSFVFMSANALFWSAAA
jgi:hypothetical protein